MKILSGTSNPLLSKSISKQLKLKLINTNIKNFADGEIYVEINENIRGNNIFIVQSISSPANDNFFNFDLRGYINKKLADLSVFKIENIAVDSFASKNEYFSHRRAKKLGENDYGRCISVIKKII